MKSVTPIIQEESKSRSSVQSKLDASNLKAFQEAEKAGNAAQTSNDILDEIERTIDENETVIGPWPGYSGLRGGIGGKPIVGGVVGTILNKLQRKIGSDLLTDQERAAREKLKNLGNTQIATYRQLEVGGRAAVVEFNNIRENVIKDTDTIPSMRAKLESQKLLIQNQLARQKIWNSIRLPDGSFPRDAPSLVDKAMSERSKAVNKIAKKSANEGKKLETKENKSSRAQKDIVIMLSPDGRKGEVKKEDVGALINEGYKVE